jgi:hypothetical protein
MSGVTVMIANLFTELTPNYAFKPIAEQALRSNQTIVPQRLNAALAFTLDRTSHLPYL